MELTPQSARSPTSPFRYPANSQPLYEYPSPAQSDSQYKPATEQQPLQGLGLYACQMTGSPAESNGSVGPLPSTTATNTWPTNHLQHRNEQPRPAQPTPNILSADYDPFATFHHPAVSAAYSHDIYGAQTATVTILPNSPAPSDHHSQRSSFSSTPASEVFTQAGSIHSFPQRVKMEEHQEYAPGGEPILLGSSPQLNHNILVTSTSPYPGSLEATFYPDQHHTIGWPKVEYTTTQDLPSISSLPVPPYDRRSESSERAGPQQPRHRPRPSTLTRTRTTRKLTTKEDANFQCDVKGCGKLFGRSYNFKAHMETHDATREYPFPCPLKDCNKKFVRKTDLQRHHQSVHMKQRNHRCDYCSRFFARKDTLRRHMEDGCSKRFDIETVDFRPQSYSNPEQCAIRVPSTRPTDMASRQSSYTNAQGLGPYDNHPLTSAGAPFLGRPEYMAAGGEASHDHAWSS